MEKIRNIVYVLTGCFSIAVLDGMFGWGLADGFYTLVGLVMVMCLVWLIVLTNKKEI